jgi:hypothetical protein
MSFAETFWPQLWATLIGVSPALLGAWWLERLLHASREKRDLARALDRSSAALEVVRSTLDFNGDPLTDLTSYLEKDQIVMAPDLRTDVWSRAQHQVLPTETDANLELELSRYFEAVAHYGRSMELLGELAFGTASALGGAADRRERLRAVLVAKGKPLAEKSRELSGRVALAVAVHQERAQALH